MDREIKICVIGLGYVGLPLARLFSTKYNTVGFDMSSNRVNALMSGHAGGTGRVITNSSCKRFCLYIRYRCNPRL